MRIQAWNLVFLTGVIVYVSIRGVFGGRTKLNQKVLTRVDRRDRTLVAVVFVGNIILPALYLFTPGWRSLIIICPRSFHGAGR